MWTSTRRRNPLTGATAWLKKSGELVNRMYWYCFDDDFGPFLLRVCTYFPFNAQLIINGNHSAQRQASEAGTGFTPLDNGFADCDDVAGLQAICESFGGAHIEALLIKWQQRLPQPFTEEDENLGRLLLPARPRSANLPDPHAGQAGVRAEDLPGAGHRRQPRRGPPGQGRADLRAPRAPRPQAAYAGLTAPECSPPASPRVCISTTSPAEESNTTRKGERSAPRSPSTIPATSACPNGCQLCPTCGSSARRRPASPRRPTHEP